MSECHYCFMSEFLSFRNQSSDLQCESLDWFLYDRELCIKRVKHIQHINPFHATGFFIYPIYPLKTFLYIPPEIPPTFRGYRKRTVAWNGLIWCSFVDLEHVRLYWEGIFLPWLHHFCCQITCCFVMSIPNSEFQRYSSQTMSWCYLINVIWIQFYIRFGDVNKISFCC